VSFSVQFFIGHAGAIVMGNMGTAESKMKALQKVNVQVVESPAHIGATMKMMLQSYRVI
jgi:succinyl-CoA synthetase alpha subunit